MKHTCKGNDYRYLFSIIIPVYNTGCYLKECIESIIYQDNIEFEKEVQLVIVNDGSSDNSEEVIKEYVIKYPKNINYIYQENQGVSAARNIGLMYIEGQYVNFLDSDDKLSKNTLSAIKNHFAQYENLIDVVSIPLYFFEGKEGGHLLNDKFKDEQIIDIEQNFQAIQMSISGTFIKSIALNEEIFNTNLKYGEDAYLITKIIMKKKKYGTTTKGMYLYRYRQTMNSTIQKAVEDKGWFLDSITKFTYPLLEEYREGRYLSKYIQYILLYDMSWKITSTRAARKIMTNKEWIYFYCKVCQVMWYINSEVIYKQKHIPLKYKMFLNILKYIPIRWCLNIKNRLNK